MRFKGLCTGLLMRPVSGNTSMLQLRKIEIWTENQYPTECSSNIDNETLDKKVTEKKLQQNPTKMEKIF